MNQPANQPTSQRALPRRAFIAASTLAVPALALPALAASTAGSAGRSDSARDQMDFEDIMKQIGRHLKTMRTPMRELESNNQWDEASFYSNQISILLVQAIEVADQIHIPAQSIDKYNGNKAQAANEAQFVTDLRIGLAGSAMASIQLSQALWVKDEQLAGQNYNALKRTRNDGHSEFQEDD